MKTATVVIGALLLMLPRLAGACPMCASQQPGGTARIVALGLMILLPFSIVFVVVRALRRAGALPADATSAGRAGADAGDARGRLRELSS